MKAGSKMRKWIVVGAAAAALALGTAVQAQEEAEPKGPQGRALGHNEKEGPQGRALGQRMKERRHDMGRHLGQRPERPRPDVDVDVTKVDNGVTVKITTDNEEMVERLQQKIREMMARRAERREQLRERIRERISEQEGKGPQGRALGHEKNEAPRGRALGHEKNEAPRGRALGHEGKEGPQGRALGHRPRLGAGAALAEQVNVEIRNIDNGVVIEITTDNEKLVERIQEGALKMFQRRRQMRERRSEGNGDGPPPWARNREGGRNPGLGNKRGPQGRALGHEKKETPPSD